MSEADVEETQFDIWDVDESWIDDGYQRIQTCAVELDPNPLDFGPGRLIDKIYQIRKFQNTVELMYVQATQDYGRVQQDRLRLEGLYNIERDNLLTTDLTVRSGRSQSDRQAMVNMKLRPLLETIERCKQNEFKLKTFLTVVDSKRSSLNSTNSQINAQMKLLSQEISLGREWKSEREEGPKKRADQPSVTDLFDTFGDGERVAAINQDVSVEDMLQSLDREIETTFTTQ